MPDPNAQVWLDDYPTVSRGRERKFETPELKPGRIYAYRLTVLWEQDGQTMRDDRKLEVSAGGTITLDYTKPQLAANGA